MIILFYSVLQYCLYFALFIVLDALLVVFIVYKLIESACVQIGQILVYDDVLKLGDVMLFV